jgi:hypothetical protein
MPLFTVTMKANRPAKEKDRLSKPSTPQALLLDILKMIFSSAFFC